MRKTKIIQLMFCAAGVNWVIHVLGQNWQQMSTWAAALLILGALQMMMGEIEKKGKGE